MATQIWVNIGTGNGLLPDGTGNAQDIYIPAMSLKITNSKLQPNLPGANELNELRRTRSMDTF